MASQAPTIKTVRVSLLMEQEIAYFLNVWALIASLSPSLSLSLLSLSLLPLSLSLPLSPSPSALSPSFPPSLSSPLSPSLSLVQERPNSLKNGCSSSVEDSELQNTTPDGQVLQVRPLRNARLLWALYSHTLLHAHTHTHTCLHAHTRAHTHLKILYFIHVSLKATKIKPLTNNNVTKIKAS